MQRSALRLRRFKILTKTVLKTLPKQSTQQSHKKLSKQSPKKLAELKQLLNLQKIAQNIVKKNPQKLKHSPKKLLFQLNLIFFLV